MKKVYGIKNLHCANCAAKIERAINELPEVEEATLNYAARRLTVVSETLVTERLQAICAKIEHGVVLCETFVEGEASKGFWREWSVLIGGTVLFVLGLIIGSESPCGIALFIIAYLISGYEVLKTAGRNLLHGKIFDENFLMGVATLGALAIGEYPEAAAIMLFYLFGEGMQERAEARSRQAIRDASLMRPESVTVLRSDGTETMIPAEEAKIGDLVRIRVGDRIPLDGVVVAGESRLDTSPVTGESFPRAVCAGDEVLSGCMNLQGVLTLRVTKTLSQSFAYRMMEAVTEAIETKPRMDRFITRFARVYTPIVVGIAAFTAIVPSVMTGNWHDWLYTAITFLVISCPCALVLSVPLSFFSGIGAASHQGILFKSGLALEALASVKAIAFDKTGTVTEGNFVCQEVRSYGKLDRRAVLRLIGMCELHSTHPIAKALVRAAEEEGLEIVPAKTVEEIAGQGIVAVIDGAEVLLGNERLLNERGIMMNELIGQEEGTAVYLAVSGVCEASVLIDDTIKADAKSGVEALREMGLKLMMLTGDRAGAAIRVASSVGIESVQAELLPADKLNAVREIREAYGSVAFVGDGLNDAPVLAGANVGMAFASGSDAASEAGDVVLMRTSFGAVAEAIRISKRTMRIAMQNIVGALSVKLLVMLLGLCGMASMWLAVFADTGVALLCVFNAVRLLKTGGRQKQGCCQRQHCA